MTQSNTKAFRASQPAPVSNSLPFKDLGNLSKQASRGLSQGPETPDPYCNDGYEDLHSRKTRTQIYHEQIIDEWLGIHDRKPTEENRRNWPRSLFEMTGRSNKTSFIDKLVIEPYSGKLPHAAKDLLERVVLDKPDLLASKDEWKNFPIVEAATKLPHLVFLVFDLIIPESTRNILKAHGTKPPSCEVCPLWDVSPALRNFRTLRDSDPDKNDRRSAAMSPAEGITEGEAPDDVQESNAPRRCLHSEINTETLLAREETLRNSLKGVLESSRVARQILASLLDVNRFDIGQENAHVIDLQSFRKILELSPDDAFTTTANSSDGYNLLQLAVGLFDQPSIDYDLQYQVIEALVRRSPASIFTKSESPDATKKNVYGRLKELASLADRQRVDKVRNLIKVECIRYRGEGAGAIDSESLQTLKRSLLYGHGETEKKLFLNLTGESAIIDDFYVKMIKTQSGMQLETVLEFVRLPNWKPEGAETNRSKKVQQAEFDAVCPFPDPYRGLFDWLWDDCKVRKIMTLEVDDSGPEPHTNWSIRAALQGPEQQRDFGIEAWKWKKFDIDVGTIFAAAPRARVVQLFSFGNITVLQGWSCRSGLAELTELKKLIVDIYPKNQKDEDDCVKYVPKFKARLTKHCLHLKESDIKITYHRSAGADAPDSSLPDASTAGTNTVLSSDRPNRGEWIEELRRYKQYIQKSYPPPKVKVAILDDGARLADLNGVQHGWSFRADSREYFVGPCKHGTEMAVCVRDICPLAELYIARLDDSQTTDKSHAFTISSCVKALKWALDLGVDIISMSWTYEMVGENSDSEKTEFEKLVKEIVDGRKAILFGSLPDLGPNKTAASRSPVGLDGVIKISSATKAGNVVEDNLHQHSDFLLPGDDIENSRGELVRGSSFATAYAAGLAALVLSSFRVLDDSLDNEDDIARIALLVAKSPVGMKGIFDNLAPGTRRESGGASGNVGRFVRPSQVLYMRTSDDDPNPSFLRDIANNLVPDTLIKRIFPAGVSADLLK